MSMLSGIIVVIVVGCSVFSASRRFGEKRKVTMAEIAAYSLLSGVVCAFSPKVPAWLAMCFLFAVLLAMFAIAVWWDANGSTIRELLIVAFIDLIFTLVGSSAAARILDLSSARVLVGIVRVLPGAAFVLSIGFFISDMIAYREWRESEDADPDEYLRGDEEESDFEVRRETLHKKMRRWLNEA